MKIGILGTGGVGTTLAGKIKELGHEVRIGSREAKDDEVRTFAEAADFGELVINATAGAAALEALAPAGDGVKGKTLLDVSNPLDFSQGMPPALTVCNDDSLGEQIQRAHPDAKVVKALNTVNSDVMVDPSVVPGEHSLFICGDDDGAKGEVKELVQSFGWPESALVDLGGIGSARGMEMYLPLWVTLMGVNETAHFNVKLVVGG